MPREQCVREERGGEQRITLGKLRVICEKKAKSFRELQDTERKCDATLKELAVLLMQDGHMRSWCGALLRDMHKKLSNQENRRDSRRKSIKETSIAERR